MEGKRRKNNGRENEEENDRKGCVWKGENEVQWSDRSCKSQDFGRNVLLLLPMSTTAQKIFYKIRIEENKTKNMPGLYFLLWKKT